MSLALSIRDLRKTYKGGFEALKGVDLDVEKGDFFALLGANGAGKSTTIGIITALVNKTAGQVEIYGHDIDRELMQAKQHIGLVPQEFNFNMFEPVAEIVINQAGYYGIPRHQAKQRAEKYLRQLGLWDKRQTEARSLSGGMKRRLMIARAMVHEPDILILDEPTAGVDIEIRHSMWEFLKQVNADGTTIILTTHYLEEAENLCRNVAIIDGGRITEHSSIKDMINKLNQELFLLDLSTPLAKAPDLPMLHPRLEDPKTLEITVDVDMPLNRVFEHLTAEGIEVLSLRTKSNRLEQLFLSRVGNNEQENRP
ncbi:MAG: ABC transporter ATP-binding protein [bacterium]